MITELEQDKNDIRRVVNGSVSLESVKRDNKAFADLVHIYIYFLFL